MRQQWPDSQRARVPGVRGGVYRCCVPRRDSSARPSLGFPDSLGKLERQVRENQVADGVSSYQAPKTLATALAISAQTLLAPMARCSDEEVAEYVTAGREEIEQDLAAVILYAVQFADRTGISLRSAVQRKAERDAAELASTCARSSARA